MAYATTTEVAAGFRPLDAEELTKCAALLDEAAVIIDACNRFATTDAKKLVSCRMVRRALSEGDAQLMPMGVTQGTVSAGGYSQTWQYGSSGGAGELYLSRAEKKLLGVGGRLGMASPWEVPDDSWD